VGAYRRRAGVAHAPVPVYAAFSMTEFRVFPGLAQLDAQHEPRDAVDQAEQAEHQREGDRTDTAAGEQRRAERNGHQPAQDEQRAGARGLLALEGDEDLEDAADEAPTRSPRAQMFRSCVALPITSACRDRRHHGGYLKSGADSAM